MAEYNQGFFKPRNPKKYKGNPARIVYRSSWEVHFMNELDRNPDILEWGSEELAIRYFDPVSGRTRRYFPDFIIKKKTKEKKIVKQIIEIKPLHQCFPPKKSAKGSSRSYLNQMAEYAKNMAKWTAAKQYCNEHNMEFIVISRNQSEHLIILTEKEIGF